MKNVKSIPKQELTQNLITTQNQSFHIQGEQLDYQAQPNVEGQCLLKTIVPIRRSGWRFLIFIICSILFLGVPCLLIFWYPHLKKKFYYLEVSLSQATHFFILNNDGQPTFPIKEEGQHYFTQTQSRQTIYFYNRYLKYLVIKDVVKAVCLDFFPRLKKIQSEGTSGLNLTQARALRKSYGIGTMIMQQKDMQDLFIDEIMRPLYIFIVISCLLWTYEQYFYYAIMIFVTAAFGIGTSLVQTYQINKKIFQMAYFQTQVNILRSGQMKRGSSRYVVPGDIVFIKDPIKIPFDGILLQGSVLANQCSITGESVPVLKKAQRLSKVEDIKQSYLFEGSILIQVNTKKTFKQGCQELQKFRQQYGLPVYVLRTNFTTTKGQLIRIISFPIQRQNIFEKQSVKFLVFLFVLAVVSYVFLIIRLSENAKPFDLFIKFLDLITVTVPPGLPISMTFGIIFALQKMKQKSIFCISPNKTVVGGMTNMLCFDKTGTLTQDFMDFNALVPTYNGEKSTYPKFAQVIQNKNEKNILQILKQNVNIGFALNNMAVNHTIIKLQTTKQNIGDPMEVKMFQFGQFQINDEHINNPDIIQRFISERGHNGQMYRRFQFDSELFRMSTIAKSTITGEHFYIYTKGSPQHMFNILNKQSVPQNYHKMLKKYTCMGFRVLAIGHKQISDEQLNFSRQDLEKNLIFDGFQIFENRLKPQTVGALMQLKEACLPFVMITGDNSLTASTIAFQSKIFDSNKKAYICDYEGGKYILQKFHDHQLKEFQQDEEKKLNTISQIIKFARQNNVQLCLTGRAFNHLFDNHFDQNRQECKILLRYVKVYARAKPNDKARIIIAYQSCGLVVAMCGDGANDCGALKQADIGLSLSQAQASVSAPFTSQITNVTSMVQLLKECRAGLATNYSLFNIMAIYSLVQYNTVLIVQFYYGFPGDFHYLYWDVCCNFSFFLTFGYTGTANKLTKQTPNCSLFSFSNLFQLLSIFFIQMLGQLFMIYCLYWRQQDIDYRDNITYQQFVEEGQQFITDSYEGNVLFMFTNFIYILTLLAFSISRPWRKQFYTNIPFTIVLVLSLTLSTILVIVPEARPQFMELDRIDNMPFLLLVLIVSLGLGLFIYLVQKFFMEPYFNKKKAKQQSHLRYL